MEPSIPELDPLIPEMDPLRRAQIILLCNLCKTAHLESHCERCDIDLCKVCVGEHLSNTSIRHKVVPYKYRKSLNYSQCLDHADEHCKHYCEECDIPICFTCVSSGEHKDHSISDILEKHESKTEWLQKDLEELETRIYPRYVEMASDVQTEKIDLERNFGKLTTAAYLQGEILHQEITAIVNQRKSAIQEMKNKHLSTLNKNTEKIAQKITEIKQTIADLKSILISNDVSLTSTYKSGNYKFRTLQSNFQVTLPSFSPQNINKDQLDEMLGSLSSLSINTEHGGTIMSPEAVSFPPVKPMRSPEAASSPAVKAMNSPEAVLSPSVKAIKSPEVVSSPPAKPIKSPEAAVSSPVNPMTSPEAVSSPPVNLLRDEPRFTSTVDTGYNELYSVSCLSEDQVWTRGNSKILKLLNLQGKLLSSIQTKSGNWPGDIAMTRGGNLFYTDREIRTVNLVKNKQILTVITLQGWEPRYVCSTASDNLLVTMVSDDRKQSKVVRYSGSTETQTIQFDGQARPLYLYAGYISENKNLDICVTDCDARAVIVVNQSGKPRFRYTGHASNTGESFHPVGITTDSQSHILTADYNNDRIHILDQDGQLLRYIHNLHNPWGLCVDRRDNLFVAECDSAKVKKIQYL